jgi:hypothetical protein
MPIETINGMIALSTVLREYKIKTIEINSLGWYYVCLFISMIGLSGNILFTKQKNDAYKTFDNNYHV